MITMRKFRCAEMLEHILRCNNFEILRKLSNDDGSVILCSCGFKMYCLDFATVRIGENPLAFHNTNCKVYQESIDTIFFYMLENGDITSDNLKMIDALLLTPYRRIRDEENHLMRTSSFEPEKKIDVKLKNAILSMEIKDAIEK